MQENIAKFIIITTVFIAIVITILILFDKELTPFFDDMSHFLMGQPKTSDFDIPKVNPDSSSSGGSNSTP